MAKLNFKSEPGEEFQSVPVPANDNKKAKFTLLSYEEYKASRAYDTSVMIIEGLMRVGTLSSVNARPSKGKTGLAINIACALVDGAPFLTRSTQKCSVVYIPVEDGNDVANRLHALDRKDIKILDADEGFSLGNGFKKSVELARDVIRTVKEADPERVPVLIIDTLRAALEGKSVLDDANTSPPLNALRKLAEDEGACIIILNHTNRSDPKNTKGETLESIANTELILIEEGDWFQIWVGKNRAGKAHYLAGKLRFTSRENDDGSQAAVVDEIVTIDGQPAEQSEERITGDRKVLRDIIQTMIMESTREHRPYGYDGPVVKIVSVSKVRTAFYRRKDGSQEGKRKAFNRCIGALLEYEWIVRDEIGENDEPVIWLASKANETNRQ